MLVILDDFPGSAGVEPCEEVVLILEDFPGAAGVVEEFVGEVGAEAVVPEVLPDFVCGVFI